MTCVSVAVLYSRFLINVIEDKYEGKSTDTGNHRHKILTIFTYSHINLIPNKPVIVLTP